MLVMRAHNLTVMDIAAAALRIELNEWQLSAL
jgi:hypothetical protein